MTISIRDLTVRYGRSTALDGVTFEVPEGAVFALLGRNGAGKSSLIRVLLGQRRADSGRCHVLGFDPWVSRPILMARVGATPESPDAPPELALGTLERTLAPLYPGWDRQQFANRLERFGVSPRARFDHLSRGQKSLAMLAIALAHSPTLLILDDPTLGLDPIARRYFYEELVVELADRGSTVFLATHDLDGAERVATHLGVLQNGVLRAAGTIESVRGDSTLEERFVELVGGERGAA